MPVEIARSPAIRAINFGPVDVAVYPRADGSTLLQSRQPLDPFDPSLARLFRQAVERAPDRVFLAERSGQPWTRMSYEQARPRVDAIAQALVDRGLSRERPVMVLSGNSIDHALLMLACFTAGIPVAPVSVAYSLQSRDHAQLRHIAELLTPGLVYVADTEAFAKALMIFRQSPTEIVATRNGAHLEGVTPFLDLLRTPPTPSLEFAVRSIKPDTIAKFLFTSGSTGVPKAVINTHWMLTSNQQALAQIWRFLDEDQLVLADWLPWNHTFGGNNNFNLILRHAGTLYIDPGRPVPSLIDETMRTLAHVSPTIYYNVPAGYGALLPLLEHDRSVAERFFARLRLIFSGGAAMPPNLWDRLERLSVAVTGARVPLTSAWGSTETAPMATAAHFPMEHVSMIGVPVPGTTLKLVPNGAKLEVRISGHNVTPGYWRAPELTERFFDQEGYYRIGDAVRFFDPLHPAKGLVFDGRISEDFKLTSGTWVHVGMLRVGAVSAAAPVFQDCLVAGEGQGEVGLLVWLSPVGCQQLLGSQPRSLHEWATDPGLRDYVRRSLARWNAEHGASSQRIARVLLLDDAPSIDHHEITDKGYINQRIGLERRTAERERLFASSPDPEVLVLD